MNTRAYLDNSATTAVCKAAADKAYHMMVSCYGNPSSLHSVGFEAEKELIAARRAVASFLSTKPETIVFTSGGTEANNLAVLGGALARRRFGTHVVTTAIEHPSVAAAVDELENQGFTVTRLRPDSSGMISSIQIEEACRADTVLVSVMMVNNETGARLPVEEALPLVRRRSPHALFHCDAVQAAGKLPISLSRWDVDLLSLSGHKLHAPKGAGALYVKKGVRLLPRALGGGQESGLRSGTEAMPALAAFGAAVEAIPDLKEQTAHFCFLQDKLLEGLKELGGISLHRPERAVPYILNFSVPGIRSETMLHFLAERDVYVSSGSACSRGKHSPVLEALGLPPREIDSALRISFCRDNTEEDIRRLLEGLRAAMDSLARYETHRPNL